MDHCCAVASHVSGRQRRVLQVVLAINVAMFLLESIGGVIAASTSLVADSMDMLGDAIVYGFSLYAVGRGAAWQARAATLKGAIMAAFGAGVLVQVAVKIARGVVPGAELMGVVGLLALAANAGCLLVLWSRRHDDVNLRSAWLCSLSDVAGNAGVLVAAAVVAATGSGVPDIVIGLSIAAMFGGAAVSVLRSARRARVASERPFERSAHRDG